MSTDWLKVGLRTLQLTSRPFVARHEKRNASFAGLWRPMVLAAALSLLGLSGPVNAFTPGEEIEASHLMRLAGYIEWPDENTVRRTSEIHVGVVESPGVLQALERLSAERTVDGRKLRAREVQTTEDLHGLHILYFSGHAWRERAAWMSHCHNQPVVIATNAAGAVDQGATIGFIYTEHRIAVQASLPAAERARVRLSSNLLRIADRVVGSKP